MRQSADGSNSRKQRRPGFSKLGLKVEHVVAVQITAKGRE